ncbi:MAG: hypothetical protein MHPSP_001706 [Paramarteilia canceri]
MWPSEQLDSAPIFELASTVTEMARVAGDPSRVNIELVLHCLQNRPVSLPEEQLNILQRKFHVHSEGKQITCQKFHNIFIDWMTELMLDLKNVDNCWLQKFCSESSISPYESNDMKSHISHNSYKSQNLQSLSEKIPLKSDEDRPVTHQVRSAEPLKSDAFFPENAQNCVLQVKQLRQKLMSKESIINSLENRNSVLASASQRLKEVLSEIKEKDGQLKSFKSEALQNKRRMLSYESHINSLSEEIKVLTTRYEKNDCDMKNAQAENDALKLNLHHMKDEITNLSIENSQLVALNESLKKENTSLETQKSEKFSQMESFEEKNSMNTTKMLICSEDWQNAMANSDKKIALVLKNLLEEKNRLHEVQRGLSEKLKALVEKFQQYKEYREVETKKIIDSKLGKMALLLADKDGENKEKTNNADVDRFISFYIFLRTNSKKILFYFFLLFSIWTTLNMTIYGSLFGKTNKLPSQYSWLKFEFDQEFLS